MKKILTFLAISLFIPVFAMSFLITKASPSCDEVDEDGYCVVVVDTEEETKTIGEEEEETKTDAFSPKNEETFEVINEQKDMSVYESTKKNTAFQQYLIEFQNVSGKYYYGDETCYVSSRQNGDSISEATKKCFTMHYTEFYADLPTLIKENKEFYTSFYKEVNSDSFKETAVKVWESVKSLFSDWFGSDAFEEDE